MTVLHAGGDRQLAFANLPPAPGDVPPGAEARSAGRRFAGCSTPRWAPTPAHATLYQILINSISHDLSLLRLFTGAPATVEHVATWPLAPDGPVEPSVEISGRLPRRCPLRHPVAQPAGLSRLPGDGHPAPRPGLPGAGLPVAVPAQRADHADRGGPPRRWRAADGVPVGDARRSSTSWSPSTRWSPRAPAR